MEKILKTSETMCQYIKHIFLDLEMVSQEFILKNEWRQISQ